MNHRTAPRLVSLAALAPAALLGAALALAPAPGLGQDDAGDDHSWVEGTWRLATPRGQAEQRRDQAVERSVSQMNAFVRPIASSRLRDSSPIDPRIVLTRHGDAMEVRFADRTRYRTTLGQTDRAERDDGTPLRVTQRFGDEGELQQTFQSEDGTRWFVYRRQGEGRMQLQVTTDSDRLPEPVSYVLDYRK